MKIAESFVTLTATHSYLEEEQSSESLQAWVGQRPAPPAEKAAPNRSTPVAGDTLTLSAGALVSRAAAARGATTAATGPCCPEEPEEGAPMDPRMEAMRRILETLTGRKIRITAFQPRQQAAPAPPPPAAASEPAGVGWGLAYDSHASYREEETTTFAAAGQIRTSDGRQIDFSLELAMHREFFQSTDISIRAGDALLTDPLVINFDTTAAELSDASFAFDLDSDGSNENLALLAPGSGFLVLDRNNDGVINNGSELFGPESGHGFAELAACDSDANGWLDDNDPIYKSLQLWIKDGSGNDYLTSLADRNIGALLLAPAESEFRLTDNGNGTLGRIRETSIFVRENGSVGTVQEIDLAV
ncbi:MAG: hypothetical protein OEV91_01215 [Desulfobulbaceae bacterium]|nr:hypothetical protein [Desulfobulbaceae bacterium]